MRRVTFRITEGIIVNGDMKLLQVVVGNLLCTAWMYTGKQDEGIIELGVTEIAGKPA